MNRAVPANETAKNPLRQFGGLHHPQRQPLLDVLTQHRGCNPSTVTLQGGSRSLNAYYSTPIYHRVWGAYHWQSKFAEAQDDASRIS